MTIIARLWRQIICRTCGRLVSETIPASTDRDGQIPSIDYTESCALCAAGSRSGTPAPFPRPK